MKKIVITGAASGIGLSTARLLAASGHKLMLLSRNASMLQTLQDELGNSVSTAVIDVTDADGLKIIANRLAHEWNGIDALINNAGIGFFDTLEEGLLENWHQMVNTNVIGLLNAIHAFLPQLISTQGHIINIGSVAAHQVFANSAVYSATKHAVFAISEGLRIELAGKIRVTTISPGAVNTPFINQTHTPRMLTEYKEYFAAGLPPEQVAEQIMHVLSLPSTSVISEIIIRPNRVIK